MAADLKKEITKSEQSRSRMNNDSEIREDEHNDAEDREQSDNSEDQSFFDSDLVGMTLVIVVDPKVLQDELKERVSVRYGVSPNGESTKEAHAKSQNRYENASEGNNNQQSSGEKKLYNTRKIVLNQLNR